jgi:hypothetical protein
VKILLSPKEIQEAKPYYLLRGIPAIGIYGNPYNFRSRLALIKLPPLMIVNAMPEQLKQQLMSALGGKTIDQAFSTKTIYAQIMVNGQTPDKKPGPYNMVFHPFGYAYNKPMLLFSNNVPMGIFNPDGISNLDIATNQFTALNVNAHDGTGLLLSPNNARFKVTPGRALSTFWSAAYSPNKRFVTITYHILANNDTMQKALVAIFQQSETLSDVLTRLKIQVEQMSGADRRALENAVEKIHTMVTPKEMNPLDILKIQLDELMQSLQQLSEQLSQLS